MRVFLLVLASVACVRYGEQFQKAHVHGGELLSAVSDQHLGRHDNSRLSWQPWRRLSALLLMANPLGASQVSGTAEASAPWACRAADIPWAPAAASGLKLILGGGWVGTAVAKLDPLSTVLTHRTLDKVEKDRLNELNAVQFILEDESTWENLPKNASVVIVTFPLNTAQAELSSKLAAMFMQQDPKPVVLLLSTTSVYSVGETLYPIIDENTPRMGIGVTGKSLVDRVAGETQWIEATGATVLELSGLVGKHPTMKERSVRTVIERSRPNGLALVNLIHIDDVCAMIRLLSNGQAAGQRVICNSGAYQFQPFATAMSLPALPESEEELLPKSTKRVVAPRLIAMLPECYEFALPVPDVPPVCPAWDAALCARSASI